MFLQKLKVVALVGMLAAVTLDVSGGLIAQDQPAAEPDAGVLPGSAPRLALEPQKAKADEPSAVVARFVEALRKRPAPLPPAKDELGLYLMDLDKGHAILIAGAVDTERGYCGSPSWSPDGRRIYFDTSPGFGRFSETRLQMYELTERGVTLTSPGLGSCPTASPDGKKLAYRLNPGAAPNVKPGIYITTMDGPDFQRVADNGFPKWSPDGKQLLTISFANPCELSLVTVANGDAVAVQLADHRIYSVPSWVQEGMLTALVRSNKTQKFVVALVDVSDPGKAKVKEALWQRGDGLTVEPLYPVYSPAAGRGAFVGREPKGQALYVLEAGKAPRRLEPKRPLDPKLASLALSPDGKYLLFCGDRAEGDKQ